MNLIDRYFAELCLRTNGTPEPRVDARALGSPFGLAPGAVRVILAQLVAEGLVEETVSHGMITARLTEAGATRCAWVPSLHHGGSSHT